MSADDAKMVDLAIGRIFGMMQRPFRRGDIEEYEACKALIVKLTGIDDLASAVVCRQNAPWPGWNFGGRNSGSVE